MYRREKRKGEIVESGVQLSMHKKGEKGRGLYKHKSTTNN